MENPIWNFTYKAASAIACLLLVAGAAIACASFLGLTESKAAVVVTSVVGACVSLFALAAAHLETARLARQQQSAIETANLLAQGSLAKNEEQGELAEALFSISEYLREKASLTQRVANGRLDENFTPISDGDCLGHSLQGMVLNLRRSIETHESREQLHHSIMKLLEEMSAVSAGDLTVKAERGPETAGAIADAFNTMTENLTLHVRRVKELTREFAAATDSIKETTEDLARGNVVQSSQLTRTTASVAKIASQIQEVSDNAELSSKVASDSLNKARSGTKAAADNINAMRCVRRQVQETAKRVKRLGERSQEIGQIVALVEDLSDRTSLLALNATLQAAAAGPAGAAFASVAEEVERLAERSNTLTRQIATLTHMINSETTEVVASMEDTVHEVVVGCALADKAGQALFALEATSSKLSELLRSITDAAKFQAKSFEDISNSMSSISEVTEMVENASIRAAESIRNLVRLSERLQESVSPFKLSSKPVVPSRITTGNEMLVLQ